MVSALKQLAWQQEEQPACSSTATSSHSSVLRSAAFISVAFKGGKGWWSSEFRPWTYLGESAVQHEHWSTDDRHQTLCWTCCHGLQRSLRSIRQDVSCTLIVLYADKLNDDAWLHCYCLSNAMHSIGQSIKSPLCPCVRACVRASYIS